MSSIQKIANGWIAYEGPSQLDNQPIVCIVTGAVNFSTNRKTGPMLQSWILRADRHPQDALNTGADSSVCGNCQLRKTTEHNRICYVNPIGLSQIYKQYQAGKYNRVANFKYVKSLRIGSYGDPVAVPVKIWQKLLARVTHSTGYTQQWVRPEFEVYKTFCMASVITSQEAQIAQALGWKTYRIKTLEQPLLTKEINCPAAKPTATINCNTCHLCNGRASNIAIDIHGLQQHSFKKIYATNS